jgi:hypothetical protein
MKKKAKLLIPCVLLAVLVIFGVYQLMQKRTIAIVKEEYASLCDEAFSDVYTLRDCVTYGLSDFSYEITDCYLSHDVSGFEYIVPLKINCQSDMDLDNTEMSLLAYEILWQVPEKFYTSNGKRVTNWDNSSDGEYQGRLTEIYVNGRLVIKPEVIRSNKSDVFYCPNCGTGLNTNHRAAEVARETGRCNWCPG